VLISWPVHLDRAADPIDLNGGDLAGVGGLVSRRAGGDGAVGGLKPDLDILGDGIGE
jgi:hypothetical protein